jgi:hypothetical protein
MNQDEWTFAFGQQHAICHRVRANAKPTGREFERQIQFGFHCEEPQGGCHENQVVRYVIACSSLGADRPPQQLRRVSGALLHRGGRRIRQWWHHFRRAQLFFPSGEQMHIVDRLHQDRFHRHLNHDRYQLPFQRQHSADGQRFQRRPLVCGPARGGLHPVDPDGFNTTRLPAKTTVSSLFQPQTQKR